LVPTGVVLGGSDGTLKSLYYSLLDVDRKLLVVEGVVLDHLTSCPIHLLCDRLELVTDFFVPKGDCKVGAFVDGLARCEGSHLVAVDGGVADVWDPVVEALAIDFDARAVVEKLPACPVELHLLFAFEALFFEEGGGVLLQDLEADCF